MARPAFKQRWTRIVPQEAGRSTYTLFSSLGLIALFALWQPIGGLIWQVVCDEKVFAEMRRQAPN